mgnify:FL=1
MTAEEERAAIVAWLNNCRAEHEKHAHRKGQKSARRHHIDACRFISEGIANAEHHKPYNQGEN